MGEMEEMRELFGIQRGDGIDETEKSQVARTRKNPGTNRGGRKWLPGTWLTRRPVVHLTGISNRNSNKHTPY
jgi:hypothetical protein